MQLIFLSCTPEGIFFADKEQHITAFSESIAKQKSVVAVGNFDGVHQGHRYIIEQIVNDAKQHNHASIIMSFEPYAREFFNQRSSQSSLSSDTLNDEDRFRLMNVLEKKRALETLGVDYLVIVQFDQQLASMQANSFVGDLLVDKLHTRSLWVGEDFRFGAKRAGDIDLLNDLSSKLNFRLNVVSDIEQNDKRVSSSLIRQCVRNSDLERVNHYLTKPWCFSGLVLHGDKRGREIGFATANIAIADNRLVMHGVFVTRCFIEYNSKTLKEVFGVCNIGVRPTYQLQKPMLEVHLFDFDEQIYDCIIHVELLSKLRDEKKFQSFDELKAQITTDVNDAKAYIKKNMLI